VATLGRPLVAPKGAHKSSGGGALASCERARLSAGVWREKSHEFAGKTDDDDSRDGRRPQTEKESSRGAGESCLREFSPKVFEQNLGQKVRQNLGKI